MIIVMQDTATQEEISAIEDRVRSEGLETRVLRGVEKTVIALIGKRPPELAEQIERMPGVFSAMPIGEPFKLAARSDATERSSIQIGNASIGKGSAMVMAGPCTVETRDQLLTTAQHVAAAGATRPTLRTGPH